ncbi:MAG: A/G-specific adenine glycosylase [Chlamydiales bacterium]|nr:A/G-specific adenine glycosylase [Chlamydiales bacterium]
MEKNSFAESFDSERLKEWFFRQRRPLPWRENPSPYQVWVSEVMLQQTQVSVVIPYYLKWMEEFPTVEALARAPLEKVIKLWEGLGYYSRARNLHAGARYLLDHHQGELPDSPAPLRKVKGLGPYTVGAILSFAYKQRAAAVDGNVFRVLARYFHILDPIDSGKVQKKVWALCEAILPQEEPWIVMEALIELGALICQKKPRCSSCPLFSSCLGKGQADLLPIKAKKQKTIHLHRDVAIIVSGNECLLKKGENGKVMADLWEFPYFDKGEKIEERLGLVLELLCSLKEVEHGFTKYRAFLNPHLYQTTKKNVPGYEWLSIKELEKIPFSSGHRKILKYLRNNHDLFIH